MEKQLRRHALKFRSIWISDVHLGFKGCRADQLLNFLHSTDSEYLYLVGDIIDLWSMKKGLYWPQAHNNVIRTILGKAKRGTRVVYIPGNHDELLRDHVGLQFGNVEVMQEAIHETCDGRRLLVMHGDEFDHAVRCNKVLEVIGTKAYDGLLELNRWCNSVRRRLGFPYWSLAAYIKHKLKNAVRYIERFQQAVVHEAQRRQVDGLICGHIHRAGLIEFDGLHYANTGDWVESCTALVEHRNGRLELLDWSVPARAAAEQPSLSSIPSKDAA